MKYLVILLLFFLQFVVLPFGTSAFETPKVLIGESIILILACYFFLFSKQQFVLNKLQLSLYGVIFLLSIIHLTFFQTDTTFLGNQFRMQGVLLLWLLLAFSLMSSQIALVWIPRWVIGGILLIQLVLAILIDSGSGRAVGTLGEPNALAVSALFVWPFLLFMSQNVKKKKVLQKRQFVFQLFGIVVALIIILLSGSRSGLVAFFIQIIFLILLVVKVDFKKAAIVAILMTSCSLILPAFQKNPYENRVEIWKTALIAGYEKPILGSGFGNSEQILEIYGDKLYTGSHGYYVDSSHNLLLDVWIQGGFIGLATIILVLYFSLKSFIVRRDKLLFTLMIGVLTASLFNPLSIVSLLQLWWLIGRGFKDS